jgi:hypothetical protein
MGKHLSPFSSSQMISNVPMAHRDETNRWSSSVQEWHIMQFMPSSRLLLDVWSKWGEGD